jgi:hypothetical protein
MKSDRFPYRVIGVFALAWALLATGPANGAMIQLSTHATGGNDPAAFDALLDFTVSGNNLTLAVTNQTAAPNAYLIREIFFNAAPELTDLTPVGLPTGFTLQTQQHAGGFGWFEYGIIGANPASGAILPGDTKIFTFTFTGAGVDESTFLTELSSGPRQMIAAAKFVIGQSGPGGYGGAAQIPTPGSTAMLFLAIMIGRPFRSRKHRTPRAT